MQTFLSYPDFTQSSKCLDDKRLGKQRVECLQILNTLQMGPYQKTEHKQRASEIIWLSCPEEEYLKSPHLFQYRRTPWYNHPAVQMWKGYEYRLTCYGVVVCSEWIARGFNDTCRDKILDHQWRLYYELETLWGVNSIGIVDRAHKPYPTWLGNEAFHASHRSNLLRKSPEHYSQFGWTEPHDLPYIWPTKQTH